MVPSLKHRTALMTAYAAGLRVSEVARLKLADIDSRRMLLWFDQGKGGQDRYIMLSPQLLIVLRAYWRKTRPGHWLFPGQDDSRPLDPSVLQTACRIARVAAKLGKPVTVHTLRDSFATHPLEAGTDPLIQVLLGHRDLSTTARYTQVAATTIGNTASPFDRLSWRKPVRPDPRRSCPHWRWRTSSVAMAPLIVGSRPLRPHRRRIMGAIEACRTSTLGGHVERCIECGLVRIAYNSCRNRHGPKCQGAARAAWLSERLL